MASAAVVEDVPITQVQLVPLDQIRASEAALRTVNTESEQFLGLQDSIKKGFVGAISVREARDKVTGDQYYEIIDGLQRYTAAKRLGLKAIPATISDMNNAEVYEAQIRMNFHRVETKFSEYAAGLKRIMTMNPLMTIGELASNLAVSPAFIEARLSLNKIINPEIKKAIDDGTMPLSNAYALAKLPENEQLGFFEDALTLPPGEFVPKVEARRKQIVEAGKQGKDVAPVVFTPAAIVQKVKIIHEEIGYPTSTANTGKIIDRIISDNMTPKQAALVALQWTMHLDPESVEAQKQDNAKKVQAAEEKKTRRDEERKQNLAHTAERRSEQATLESRIAQGIISGTIDKGKEKEMRNELKARFKKEDEDKAAAEVKAEVEAVPA